MGDFLRSKGDKTGAKGAYQQVLALTPPKAVGSRAAESLGYMLWEEGDFSGAVSVLKTGLRYDECNIRAVLTLANSYVKLNQTPEAITQLRDALSLPKSEPERKRMKALGD